MHDAFLYNEKKKIMKRELKEFNSLSVKNVNRN